MSDSCDPMDCSLLGSSVVGFSRILEWVTISFSRGASQPRNQVQVSCPGIPWERRLTVGWPQSSVGIESARDAELHVRFTDSWACAHGAPLRRFQPPKASCVSLPSWNLLPHQGPLHGYVGCAVAKDSMLRSVPGLVSCFELPSWNS